jgi:hypothetical protein
VLLAIGKVCQEASTRMPGPAAPPPVDTVPAETAPVDTAPAVAPPPAPEPAEAQAPAEEAEAPLALTPIEPQAGPNGNGSSQPHSLETPPLPTPTFGQIGRAGRTWRIPLVSSFLLTTACLALMRLL